MKQLVCEQCSKILSYHPISDDYIYLGGEGQMYLFCSKECKKKWEKNETDNMLKRFKVQLEVSDERG